MVGYAYCPPVSLDGEVVGCLKNGGYLRLDLEPGIHELRFESRLFESIEEIRLAVEVTAGQELFYQWQAQMHPPVALVSGIPAGVSVSRRLRPISKSAALYLLPSLRLSH